MENLTQITAYEISKIYELFQEHNWPIIEDNKMSLYRRFIKTYTKLDEPERELFIKLCNEYKLVKANEYQNLLIQLLKKVIDKYLTNKQVVWIYPIKKNSEWSLIKSSDVVTYLCKSMELKYDDVLCKKTFNIISDYAELNDKKQKLQRTCVIILDDFIGSGNYACSVVDEILKLGISLNNIIVCSLFIAESGIKKLKAKQYKFEYVEMAENYVNKLTTKEKNTLQNIEEKLLVDDQYKFGYEQSGTLISLLRSPNNTLPIFWLEKGRSHSALFPR